MTTESLALIPGLLLYGSFFGGGLLMGAAFLWGLWITVNRLPDSRHPAALMLTSLFLRLGLTLAGFYALALHGGAGALLTAAVGFTLPRLLAAHRIRRLNGCREVARP